MKDNRNTYSVSDSTHKIESKINFENLRVKNDLGFGEICANMRQKMGLSKENFGGVFGLSMSDVCRLERGVMPKNKHKIRKLSQVARRMGVI